jgi:hypothetical protein
MRFCQLLQASFTLEIKPYVYIGFKEEIISPLIIQCFKLIGSIGIKYPELRVDLRLYEKSFFLAQ